MMGPGRFGNILNQETIKPRNLSETLVRLGSYFGRFCDNARINRTSDRLFPCPGGRFCIWELRLTLRGRSKWITASTNDF